MDILKLKKEKLYGEKLSVCIIYLNNKAFLEMVKEHEMPYAKKYNQESIAGDYMYALADELYKEFTDKSYRLEEDKIVLLICGGCGVYGCWDLLVNIRETENTVIWENFHNPHRTKESPGGFWDYSDFGIFEFDKNNYYREIEKLKIAK